MGILADAFKAQSQGESLPEINFDLNNSSSKKTSWFGNTISSLLDIFDSGAEIYFSVADRLQATKMVEDETVYDKDPVVVSAKEALTQEKNNRMLYLGIGGAILGTLLLVAVIKK